MAVAAAAGVEKKTCTMDRQDGKEIAARLDNSCLALPWTSPA